MASRPHQGKRALQARATPALSTFAAACLLACMPISRVQAQTQSGAQAQAQSLGQAPGTAVPATPAAAPATPATPAGDPRSQRVDIQSGRNNDMEERRRSTAAKIVIGREEIEQYGDTSTVEILKRLPGITVPGAPGRGGPPRMRGMGGNYTQILVDGERVPWGFSLDNLAPEQIERIEILRAPTAETGARAVAGTINIVMREGYRRRLNDLKIGGAVERGRHQSGVSWTRNDTWEQLIYNLSVSVFQRDAADRAIADTDRYDNLGAHTLSREERVATSSARRGLSATGRLQWRGEQGNGLTLTPFLIRSAGTSLRSSTLEQTLGTPDQPKPFDSSRTEGSGSFSINRLSALWTHTVGDGNRLEWRATAGDSRWDTRSKRFEYGAAAAAFSNPRLDTDARIHDTNLNAGLKLTRLLENQHNLVGGLEAESNKRDETRVILGDPSTAPGDYGDSLAARVMRVAGYAQDEWTISPQWAAHAGLRWEGIRTEGDPGTGVMQSNTSNVWTPLVHGVWKFQPGGRDQLRMSLTRSYKSPTLQNLIARPTPSAGVNSPINPDRYGNPGLRPELATGVDLAIESYLPSGGILSANFFRRNLSDYIRTVTLQGDGGRWISRPLNVGEATTQGLELEAKFRLSDWIAEAPKIDFRNNLSLFDSSVRNINLPNNRIDEQPRGTMNLGLDYRFKAIPLAVGSSVNVTAFTTTQVSEQQVKTAGFKRVYDGYMALNITPTTVLRLSLSNYVPIDYITGNTFQASSFREIGRNIDTSAVNTRLGLEMKL